MGIAAAHLLNLQAKGVELVGHIPQGLPRLTLPVVSLVQQLWPGALGIALMSFTETVAAGRAFAKSDEPSLQANRELMATGAANIGGAFFGAMPGGEGTSQTAVNRLAGAKTQVSELVTAAMTLLTMLLLAPLIGLMPQATLAAVVIVYSLGLIKPKEFREILTIRRTEFIWALLAFAGVVLLGTLKGIIVAIIVSLIALGVPGCGPASLCSGTQAGHECLSSEIRRSPGRRDLSWLAAASRRRSNLPCQCGTDPVQNQALVEEFQPKIVALHMRSVPDIEFTALKMLIEAEKRNHDRGIRLWLVGVDPDVLEMIQRSPLGEAVGSDAMHFNLEKSRWTNTRKG